MRLYYIASSMLLDNEFAYEMANRFLMHLENEPCDCIIISGEDYDLGLMEEFMELVGNLGVPLILSTTQFELHGIQGKVDDVSLYIQDYPELIALSGEMIVIEVEASIRHYRVYFDMFAKHAITELMNLDYDFERIEALLEEKIGKSGGKKQNHH
ncbi:MAG: hypothetical protein ACRDBX_00770 [Erysipelotrichaceae bacterium]